MLKSKKTLVKGGIKMKHFVTFDNQENHWDNALPLGNGVFGCMLFYEKHRLYMPMNHYEIYYNISDSVLPDDILAALPECEAPGALHKKYHSRAVANTPPDGEPHCLYRTDRELAFREKEFGIAELSNTYPQTGELIFSFSEKLKASAHKLSLCVEDAATKLDITSNEDSVKIKTIVSREDCIINEVSQSESGLLDEITVSFPTYRETKSNGSTFGANSVTYEQQDEHTVVYTVTYALSDKRSFTFSGGLKLSGATFEISEISGNSAVLKIKEAQTDFSVLTGICTEWKYENTKASALLKINEFTNHKKTLMTEHEKYWKEFFARSSISIPDKFLEKVYIINQYALDCCSGRDGIMKHHACGLNGLWAIRHPNIWGSMWYWDVNIQAAFAGVFSSNRLELAKVFSDGLLSYQKLAEYSANAVHGLPGVASDYPYDFYYSCWMWCAQYLWFLYEYSLDKEYLKSDAYPLFLKLCEFALGIFEYDESTDTYNVYPDISPEQGPLAHNTVITVACTKYLFKFTLEAAKVLGDTTAILEKIKKVLPKFPEYPITSSGKYGMRFKDSFDAPDNLWLRHPSLLMPVFPVGEFDMSSDDNTQELILNTLDYLEENCEIGIFGGSWIAAAAARMGKGQMALRILYERGIDHMLRTNGLSAEDTERFTNFCLIGRQPLYYPCMMEFTGEMLAAVNEMLLQSHNGIVRVFPALPDGKRDFGRAIRNGDSVSEYTERFTDYDAWRDVRFDKLLAKGAFEISAALTNGNLEFILVHSKKGGKIKVACPYLTNEIYIFSGYENISFVERDNIVSFETEAGKSYMISKQPDTNASLFDNFQDNGITTHNTHTRRTISIGENAETTYQRKLDKFTRDFCLGNVRMSNRTVYKFDFTNESEKKYSDFFPIQCYVNQGHHMNTLDFFRIGAEEFTSARGFGFSSADGVRISSSSAPDALRTDFAEGELDTDFIIDAPRGQYELLIISGDSNEDSVTIATCENSRKIGGDVVPKGIYQCEIIPIIQEYDEPIRIKISTRQGFRWKLNSIMLNIVRAY